MRILLIAYDFPPLGSPQAIRWYYLSRELAKQGLDIHVLAPDLSHLQGLKVPGGVTVHRCVAGGLQGLVARRRRNKTTNDHETTARTLEPPAFGLNWKGRLYKRLDALIGSWTFPDSRGQWRKFALSEASRLIAEIKPSIIISSHEPPVTLEVGLACAGRVPWLVDLGDPVLAPYTPARWRSYARRLEAAVCESAGLISATTEATRQLLIKRHGVEPEKIFVLTQGYDDALPVDLSWEPPRVTKERWLELLYTGRFYAFRDPTALLEAVLLQDRVRLTIIAPEISESHKRLVARSEGRIVYMGEQSHSTVLESQRHCDVLVNIGNDLEAQSPGKLFEYFGSGKPILHCYSRNDDPSVGLLEDLGRGWSCRNATGEIASLLQQMVSPPYVLFSSLSDKREVLEVFGWSRIALQLKQRCEHLVETAKHVSARRRPI